MRLSVSRGGFPGPEWARLKSGRLWKLPVYQQRRGRRTCARVTGPPGLYNGAMMAPPHGRGYNLLGLRPKLLLDERGFQRGADAADAVGDFDAVSIKKADAARIHVVVAGVNNV